MKINANLSFRGQISKLSERHSQLLDRYQYGILAVMMLLLLYWCVSALERPISKQQQLEISRYTTQSLYPYSSDMANNLLLQEQAITQSQYFKFLRVVHREQTRIHYQEDENVQP